MTWQESVKALGLPEGEWCVVGGAALELYGIRHNHHDIDILVTNELFEVLQSDPNYKIDYLSEMMGRTCLVYQGELTFPETPQWETPVDLWTDQNRAQLLRTEILPLSNFTDCRPVTLNYIVHAVNTDGIPHIGLADLLEWKQATKREKDQSDIKLLEKFLRER